MNKKIEKVKFVAIKLFILLTGFCICSLPIHSQKSEVDSVNFPILLHPNFPLSFHEQMRQNLVKSSMETKKTLPLLQYEKHKYNISTYNLNLDKNSLLHYPVYHLGENSMLYMSRTNDLMPGMADVNNINLGMKMQPTEGWYLDISNSAYKYRDFTGIYNDYTINASSYISLSDNFGINVYGSYSTQAMNNTNAGSIPYSPFAPYSYYGGSLEYKITDKFGIEVGMLRQYNTWRRKWENVYFAAPKFYK